MNPIAHSLAWCLLAGLSVVAAHADPLSLPKPEGKVLLEISGDIRYTNAGDKARFDREMLDALPSRVVSTHTPWTDRERQFRGPLLRDLLSRVGAHGDQLRVEALNHFSGEIPVSDVQDYAVILAMTMDGEPLAIRDFGPLFVLYPFDENPELNTENIRYRSVWQVAKIHVH
ncbi:molybdopterin-dependent oxidoreductase [Halomonas sp. I5-271120]|uniref:molybdopterin-dependent oxidoreductase n=1 Tax=Halomonas sp. I5-271120 TaxID=3061632 RepID=UPI002714D912|nr:molybdopterin-dependent oxidoreductase [Halomonas sp. I5-271120]